MIDQLETDIGFDPRAVAYTGPGTLAGSYLRTFWQPVYGSHLIETSRAKQITILGEQFTLFRDDKDKPHLVDNRCAHRGTQLSVGTVEADTIRCLYHGWRFAADGQCVEQPGEPEPFCQKIRIKSYPVRDYLGIIFAYLGEGDAPEFPRYEHFEENSNALRLMVEVAPFNYFQRLENSHDFVHLPFVHKHAFPKGPRTLETFVPRVASEECSWGMMTHRLEANGQHLIAYFGMPNVNYVFIGGGNGREWEGKGEFLLIRVPIDDNSHLQFMLSWTDGHADDGELPSSVLGSGLHNQVRNEMVRSVLEGELTMDDVIATAHPDLFNIEDDVAMRGQGTIWQRSPEHLGRSDVGVILLRKLWARDLRALRDGQLRQKWFRQPDMFPRVVAIPRDARQ